MSEEKTTKTVEDYLPTEKTKTPELPWQSTSIDKLAQALSKAQAEMTMVEAESSNPFFNSKYASLAAVLKTVIPALTKHGLSISQGSRYCTYTNGFYVTATLMHGSGQWQRSELRMPIGKKDAHGVGAAMTYGRRYLIAALCGVAQEDDDGNGALNQTK